MVENLFNMQEFLIYWWLEWNTNREFLGLSPKNIICSSLFRRSTGDKEKKVLWQWQQVEPKMSSDLLESFTGTGLALITSVVVLIILGPML